MITLVDLKKAVIQLLKTKIPDVPVVAQSVEEGFDKPAFFVQVLPVNTTLMNQRLFTERVLVVINYFPRNKTKEEKDAVSLEVLKMTDRLKAFLFPNIKVKDRSITIGQIDSAETEGFLSLSFSVRYIEAFEVVDDSELMQDLNIKSEVLN